MTRGTGMALVKGDGSAEDAKPTKKVSSKKTTIRMPADVYDAIRQHAERRGRSLNTTILDLIEGGFDWLRTRFQALK